MPQRALAFLRAKLALAAAAAIVLSATFTAHAQGIALVRDTEIEEYLWDQSRPVFRAAGLDDKNITIYIVNDRSINAFVAGGQNMFIFTGLMLELDKPGQLLGVIAHETGHIAGGHLARAGGALAEETMPFLITMLAGIAAIAAGAGDAGVAILLGSQGMMMRTALGYSRVQENSADQAAVTFLDKIGKSSQGMLEVFQGFMQQELMTPGMQDPFVRSHPLSSDRIAALEDRVARSPNTGVPDSPEDVRRYAMIRAKLVGYIERPDVTMRLFPPRDTSQPARYARAVAFMRAADFQNALREIDSLIAEEPRNPYFHEVKGQILFDSGQMAASIAPLQTAVKLKPNAPLLQVNLAAAIVAADVPEHMGQAEEILRRSLRGDPSNAYAWMQLAIVYSRMGNDPMAALATAELRFMAGQWPDAIQFAERAMKGLPAGSRDAARAQDIIEIAKAQMPESERRGQRRLNPFQPAQAGAAQDTLP